MADLMQDVTITLNMSEMTVTKYKQVMAMLEQLSQNPLETHTYTDEMPDMLTDDHKKMLNEYRGVTNG